MSKPKTILLIGGNSFVAQQFTKQYKDEFNFISVTRKPIHGLQSKVCEDFSMLEDELFHGVDAVINFSAIVHKRESKISDELYEKINTDLPVSIALKARKANVVQFIQLSTVAVYGNAEKIDAGSMTNPTTKYGISKLKADSILATMNSDIFHVCILRPPMVYGGGNAPGNMMRLIQLVKKGIPLPFQGVNNLRDFIHVSNLCAYLHESIIRAVQGTFLITDNHPVGIEKLYSLIASTSGVRNRAFRLPVFMHQIILFLLPSVYRKLFTSLEINTTKTNSYFNFKPKDLLQNGISEMCVKA